MISEALVSIIIPALDAASVIRNSVESVLRQTYSNIEVIVVDNGSSDGTCEAVQELTQLDGRVRLVESGRAVVSSARNMGIEKARGEFIAFCDADDEMAQDAISSLLKRTNVADIVAGGMSFDVVDDKGSIVSSLARQLTVPFGVQGEGLGQYFEDLWAKNYLQSCWSKLYSVQFLRKSGVRFDERLSSYEDLSFVLDCLSHGASITAIPDICYRYFRSTSESNSTRYKSNMTDQMQLVSENVASFYEKVLKKPKDASYFMHVAQLLVVSVNNAQAAPDDGRTIRTAIADVFSRRVFTETVSSATSYPNGYSRLVCLLGSRRCYGLVAVLARFRNWVRGKRAAR